MFRIIPGSFHAGLHEPTHGELEDVVRPGLHWHVSRIVYWIVLDYILGHLLTACAAACVIGTTSSPRPGVVQVPVGWPGGREVLMLQQTYQLGMFAAVGGPGTEDQL